MSSRTTIHAILRVKHVIDGMKAIDTSVLTQTEREAVQECLDHAYDRAAYFLTALGEQRPRLIPVCLIMSITLAFLMQQVEFSVISSFSGE